MNLQKLAQQVFEIESKALLDMAARLDASFVEALNCLHNCEGRVVICGMGKSGLVGKKIAATLASIGRPSFFMHPSEAIHGDLGMLMPNDCLISISNSGETDEILQILPYVLRLGLIHIAMVGNKNSTLAKHANFVLDIGVEQEASSLAAVPMASAICTLAMGHALAAALITFRNFQQEDFVKLHPGGSLGRKLLTSVRNEMLKTDLPIVSAQTSIRELLMVMSKSKLGLAVVLTENKMLDGIVTDGDLRRALERFSDEQFFKLSSKEIMTTSPKFIGPEASLLEAEELMRKNKISALLVLDNQNKFLGIIAKHQIR